MGSAAPAVSKWKFLSDDAVINDLFGVHGTFARLLVQMARTCETPFSIALYSNWGTGKTTIAKLIQKFVAGDEQLVFLYLDIWKYSADPLKRWILLETHRQLSERGFLQEYKYKDRSIESYLEYEEAWEQKEALQFNIEGLKKLGRLSTIAFTLAAVLLVLLFFFVPPTSRVYGVVTTGIGSLLGAGICGLLFKEGSKKAFHQLSSMIFTQRTKQLTAKPAFSSETFSEIFSDVVRKVTSGEKDRRLIFVFDNLDRCPESIAVEAISVIKTYLGEPGCIYIFPCDEQSLLKHISRSYLSGSDANGAQSYAKEFLDKFFQASIHLPILPDVDIEDYLNKQLVESGMNDLPVEAKEVLLFACSRKTPRQVKRVLNDLITFRTLATQAEADELITAGTLTQNLPLLAKMSAISTKFPEFLAVVAADPEIWTEKHASYVQGKKAAKPDSTGDLESFLWATRLVSPEADIRPFLYLKAIRYETDLKLRAKVEDLLSSGKTAEFVELFKALEEPKRDDVIRISVTAARRWLTANRTLSLQNAARPLLKAAVSNSHDRDLKITALSVLERLAIDKNAGDLLKLVDVSDVFALDPGPAAAQKNIAIRKIVLLFSLDNPTTPELSDAWKVILGNQQQLEEDSKREIAELLLTRFGNSEQGERDVQLILDQYAKPSRSYLWCMRPELLAAFVSKATFKGGEPDNGRLRQIAGFLAVASEGILRSLVEKMAPLVSGSRTREFDVTAKNVINYMLVQLETAVSADLTPMWPPLLEQVEAHQLAEKGYWIRPLVRQHTLLPENLVQQFNNILQGILADPADPTALLSFLANLEPRNCEKLLGIEAAVKSLTSQAAALQNRYAGNKVSYRKQILAAFPPKVLIEHSEVLDNTLTWDVCSYFDIVRSALKEGLDVAACRERLEEFTLQFLDQPQVSPEIFKSVKAVLQEQPELFSTKLVSSLAEAGLRLIPNNVSEYYPDFLLAAKVLGEAERKSLIRSLASHYFSTRTQFWTELLSLVVTTIVEDGELARDPDLVTELFDFCFEAASEDVTRGTESLLRLAPILTLSTREAYLERALEVLIGLEAAGTEMTRLEPFMQLVEQFGTEIKASSLMLAGKFVKRMLAPASGVEEKARTLMFLTRLANSEVTQNATDELERLADGENTELSEKARSLVRRTEG